VLARVHNWLDRHPTAGDACIALVVFGFSLSTLVGSTADARAVDIVLTVLLCAPLVVRRRAPILAFAAVMLACGAELALVDDFLAANGAALAAAQERGRIARELHDVVAHSLSVVIAQADGGRYAAARDPAAATDALQTIAASAREAQGEMRRALGLLDRERTPPMAPQPGIGELASLLERSRDAGLPIDFAERGPARRSPPQPA
jgi:signal transduction histidine kinase